VLTRLLLGQASVNRALNNRTLDRAVRTYLRPGLHVLIAGGGREASSSEDVVLRRLPARTRVTTVDLSLAPRPNVAADLAATWPFAESTFDVIVATAVLEHIVEPRRFFAETYRVLRPGGVLICTTPFIYRMHSAPEDYWRFTSAAITQLARTAGLSVVEVRPVGGTPFLAAIALLWPLLRVPPVGTLALILGWLLDRALLVLTALFRRGRSLVMSYPLSYLSILRKT